MTADVVCMAYQTNGADLQPGSDKELIGSVNNIRLSQAVRLSIQPWKLASVSVSKTVRVYASPEPSMSRNFDELGAVE